jgi:uncharacterized protein YgbK (DUF1537 family)
LRLGAIADDVTGASDLCSALAGAGLRTVMTLGPSPVPAWPEADALVVALKSRTAPVSNAVDMSLDALSSLLDLGAEQIYFKYCSTFDSTRNGNIGPVADALSQALGVKVTVVCPAYPANGRTLYQGHLFVDDRLLSESAMAFHPLTPMTDPDIVRHLSAQTPHPVALVPHQLVRRGPEAVRQVLDALGRAVTSYAVTDAIDEEDLDTIARACAGSRLVTGGSALAKSLAAHLPAGGGGREAPSAPRPEVARGGPAVVLAGSCSAATLGQVERMKAQHPALELDVLEAASRPSYVTDIADEAAALMASGPVLVYTTAGPERVRYVQAKLGADWAAEAAEQCLAQVARRLVDLGAQRVIVAGGETSAAVLESIGPRALLTGPEIAPGVPWMVSTDGSPLAFALKSGNFGGPAFFLEALAMTR